MACIHLWTEEEKAMLKQLIEAGVALKDAAPVFKDRTRESVRTQAGNMGLTWPQRKSEIDHDLFKQLIKDAGKRKCI